jgi:phosphatidylglycerophosphatase C
MRCNRVVRRRDTLRAGWLMNLALFDFDGTITTSDTFTPFIRLAATPGRMLAGSVLLGPLALGYRLGAVSASRARPAVARVAFRGASAADVRCLGRKYAADVLPGTLRQRALERVARHQEQGDDVVVVSASLDVYLRPWCESRGLGCICTELEELNGRLTGRYRHGDCSGAEKVRQIRERYALERYAQVYAYGDTSEDREMLALAHRRYYRWQEIADWNGAMDHGHPRAARPARG